MGAIKMVDLGREYQELKPEIDNAMQEVLVSSAFVKSAPVQQFETSLGKYLNCLYCIGVGNGTDALQLALMALDLNPGDEVVVPDFTFIASAEVVSFLGLKPVFAPVCEDTFLLDLDWLEANLSETVKAIIPVHLFGQCVNMQRLNEIVKPFKCSVIEDNAQAIGAKVNGKMAGSQSDIGITSFFPSKNLGCYGDGGAVFTNLEHFGEKIKSLANHGSVLKYHHHEVGINSRLDGIQAAILNVKLPLLNTYCEKRGMIAQFYNESLKDIKEVNIPVLEEDSTHVYHQYTLKVKDRDRLQKHLGKLGIPSMIYYPIPLTRQKAFAQMESTHFESTDKLCSSVLSLPIHPYLTKQEQQRICDAIKSFYHD